MIAFLLTLLATAQAASKLLPRDLELTWALGTDKDITFTLTVPAVNVVDYNWWGISFQKKNEKSIKGDMIVIDKEKGVLDSYMNGNKKPTLDKKKNLSDVSLELVGDNYVASWSRKLKNKDSKDMKLEVDKTYKIMWFFGKNSETGSMLAFEQEDYGKSTIKIEKEEAEAESDDPEVRRLQFLSDEDDVDDEESNFSITQFILTAFKRLI